MKQTTNINGQTQQMETGDMKSEMQRIAQKGYTQHSSYEHSFGPIADKSCYMNGWQKDAEGKGFDLRSFIGHKSSEGFMRIQSKALGPQTGGAGTAGYALVPVYVDPRIVDQSRKYTPLVEMIPRVTNQGLTADYNVMTAKGSAFTAYPDGSMNEEDDTYDRKSQSIKFLYSVGRVLGPMQAAMPSYIMEGFQPSGAGNETGGVFTPANAPNAKQQQVLVKSRALKELEENLILNGDDDSDATEFNGILDQQGTTNQYDLDGTALSWKDVDNAIELAFEDGGRPKLAVGSTNVVTQLRQIMIDTFRMTPDSLTAGAELPFGIPPQIVLHTMVGPMPCIPSMYLSNTSGSRQLWFLDTDFIEMRVLQDMTYEELAKTNDSGKFMLKIYECLIVRAPSFNAFIDNIL